MKRYVTVAVIFGASNLPTLKRAFGALTVEWGNRSLSNTAIQNAFRGKVNLIRKPLQNQFMKANQFYPGRETAGTWIASIPNISKRLDLR
jgi:hypothetical protein